MKKVLTILLSVLMAACLCGFATIAFADGEDTPTVTENKTFSIGDFVAFDNSQSGIAFVKPTDIVIDGGEDAFQGYGWLFNINSLVNDLSLVTMDTASGDHYQCSTIINYNAARDPLQIEFRMSDYNTATPAVGDYLTIGKGLTIATANNGTYEVKETIYYVWNGTTFIKGDKAPLAIENISFDAPVEGESHWNALLIRFNANCGVASPWGPAPDMNYIDYVSAENVAIDGLNPVTMNEYIFIFNHVATANEMITLKAGLEFGGKKLYNDVSYITLNGLEFDVINATELNAEDVTLFVDATENVVFTSGDYPTLPVTYTIENEEIATVVGKGLTARVTGVSAGTTTLTATFAGITKTVNITVENVGAELDHITVDGKITAHKMDTALDLSTLTGTRHYSDESTSNFTVTEDMISGEYDLNTVDTYTLTVTLNDKTCNVTLEVLEMPELTVVDINYAAWANALLINFNEKVKQEGDYDTNHIDLVHIELVDSNGDALTYSLQRRETYIFASVNAPNVGDRITIKAGTIFGTKELKQDVTYVSEVANATWVVYDPAVHKVDSIELTAGRSFLAEGTTLALTATLNEGAVGTAKFSSSNTDVATVDANGVVSGVKPGDVVITAKAGGKTATINLQVTEPLTMTGVELSNSYMIWVEKDQKIVLPTDFSAHVVFEGDFVGEDFALTADNFRLADVDTSVVTDISDVTAFVTVKGYITYEGEEYEVDVNVKVFEPMDMTVKEIAIVDWFDCYVFVEYPNSSMNNSNITGVTLDGITKISYYRADGTEVKLSEMQLGGPGNILVIPGFEDADKMTLENYLDEKYYRNGDKIVLHAGLTGYYWTGKTHKTATDNAAITEHTGMVIRECVLQEELTYVYNTETLLWEIYVPYTGIEKANDSVNVVVGKSTSLGVAKVPANATTGVVTYTVADETIATVNAKTGSVTGVKEGTTTVTATVSGDAGEFSVTVTVNVTDGITGIEFAEGTNVKVKVGAESIDFTGVTANFVYASGRKVAVDLSKANVRGFDSAEEGEISVVVSAVGPDGVTYRTTLKVTVEKAKKSGCGSSALGLVSALTMVTAGAFVVLKKKK